MVSFVGRIARRTIVAAAWLVVAAVPIAAQTTGTVRGRVMEAETGRPLGGAQVFIPGTELGGIANAAGEFLLVAVPAGAHTLRVTMLGYAPAEADVEVREGTAARVDFELRAAAISLDEIVVTGTAGAASKRTLGNAITKLDAVDVVAKTTITSVTELLQSRTPGVQILPNAGTPGAAADIRIRGAGSFLGNRPVVFVDGVRYNIDDLGNFAPSGAATTSYSAQSTSAFDFVNPNDIESIEVIKGPAASTLYGAEAANGVIQIITKKGARGDQGVRWDVRVERGQNEWAVDIPDNYTTCDAARIAERDASDDPVWPGCQLVAEGTVLRDNPLRRDPEALRVGAVERVSLAARGGGDRYAYYFAGDLNNEDGVFHNSYSDRKSIRGNFTIIPSDMAEIQFTTSYARGELRLPVGDEAFQGMLLSAFRGKPGRVTVNPKNEGWYSSRPEQANAYNNSTRTDRLTLGATASVNPLPWFRNRLTVGFDYTASLAQIISPPGSADADYAGVPEGVVAQRVPRSYLYTLDYVGNIDRPLMDDFQSVTSFGMQAVSRRRETVSAVGTGFGAPDVTLIGTAQATVGSNGYVENKSVGFYVQEQIGWQNRLFLTGAVRADDNSSFGENFDWIYYPKASLSWMVSEEPAFEEWLDAMRLNAFKFRIAYGHAGRAPDPFSATQTYTLDKAVLGDGAIASALRASSFGNPDLKPERGAELEAGFDAGLFEDRIGIEFTYYRNTMRDVIISLAPPGSSGFGSTFYGSAGSILKNLGETRNSGVELSITAVPVQTPRFGWSAGLTLATNSNELVTFGDDREEMLVSGQSYGAMQRHRPGYPLAGYWAQLPERGADGRPILDESGVVQLLDLDYIGPSAPTREVGFANTFTFLRDFRLFVLLDHKGGHYLYNYKEYNRCRFHLNCERINDPGLANDPERPVWLQVPAAYIEKADFVKLRDVSLTYSLPLEWAQRLRAGAASVTAAGHNLAVWSDYSGIDPESNSYGNRDFARADIYPVPMLRRLSMSLNLSF